MHILSFLFFQHRETALLIYYTSINNHDISGANQSFTENLPLYQIYRAIVLSILYCIQYLHVENKLCLMKIRLNI